MKGGCNGGPEMTPRDERCARAALESGVFGEGETIRKRQNINLISRESLTAKSCKALNLSLARAHGCARRASLRLSTTPAPFNTMKLQPLKGKNYNI
jgi:hypothetical protein